MKNGFRIRLLLVVLLLGFIIFALTRTFFVTGFGEISGLGTAAVLPAAILGKERIPEFIMNLLSQGHMDLVDSVVGNPFSIGLVITYAISAVLLITLVYLVISTIFALFRFIFDKPYRRRRKRYFVLAVFNLIVIGLCFACSKIEAINALITTGGYVVYQPQIWYYIFVGGLLLSYIVSILTYKRFTLEELME